MVVLLLTNGCENDAKNWMEKRCAAMLRVRAVAGNGRHRHATVPQRDRPMRRDLTGCLLQIVDNLHGRPSNRNMQKFQTMRESPSLASRSAVRLSDSGSTIALLQSNSLPMLVQREVERLILAGDLATGAKLNEATIADMLG